MKSNHLNSLNIKKKEMLKHLLLHIELIKLMGLKI